MSNWGVYSLGLCGYVVRVNEDCESVSWYFDNGAEKEHKLHHAITSEKQSRKKMQKVVK